VTKSTDCCRTDDLGTLQQDLERWRRDGATIGLVPTMGALHAGHTSLIEHLKTSTDRVVVSIFVNPKQFGEATDFADYPSAPEGDTERATQAGADRVWFATAPQIYPANFSCTVQAGGPAIGFEGDGRPGHFDGVATVLMRLFGLVRPDAAAFGAKDYQQLLLAKCLVRDFALPIRIVGCAVVRDSDGLALSSRNARLQPAQRRSALAVPQALQRTCAAFAAGERDVDRLSAIGHNHLTAAGHRVSYFSLVDRGSARPLSGVLSANGEEARLITAAEVHGVRLLDTCDLDDPPCQA
jgi:pantoate--beta-alanine ligase